MTSPTKLFCFGLLLACLLPAQDAWSATNDFFAIQVVDDQTGHGVPLVRLHTVNKIDFWTDSNGYVAFNEPGLMEHDVYFSITSPGYEVPADGFQNRGTKLHPTPGGGSVIRIKRLNIAERLYRVTGQGIYRDSLLLGKPVPLTRPVLNGQVMGQDTVVGVPYRGRLYWFWGDTDQPSYPLGNFGVTGATSEIPGRGGLDPGVGIDLSYFVGKDGFARPMCPQPGNDMRWLEGTMVVADSSGHERLVARMAHERDLGYAHGWDLMVFNDEKERFESIQHWDIHQVHRSAHPFRVRRDGADWYYIFPDLRVPATLDALADLKKYEALTCLKDGTDGTKPEVDRDDSGKPRFAWKSGVELIHPGRVRELLHARKLRRNETWNCLTDIETGATLAGGLECVAWNDFRKRWIGFLPDKPGEAWFAEADTPVGPWGYARRVVTHGDYNFYNLAQDSFFDQENGRLVYFEGTYTATFSAARAETPRYDYNQLMYRLDLGNPRLELPVAVYRVRGTNGVTRFLLREQIEAERVSENVEEVACFALPSTARSGNLTPVYASGDQGGVLSLMPPSPVSPPLFYGLSTDTKTTGRRGPELATLTEFKRASDGRMIYSTAAQPPVGTDSAGRPLCRVWPAPNTVFAPDWKAEAIHGPPGRKF